MKRLLTLLALACAAATSFGATLNPIQLLNPAGSTSGQAIVSTGASSAPAWGNVTATALAAQAANTVVANVTGSSASPTAFAMPSCSASILQYTSGTGFTCSTSITDAGNSTATITATNTGSNGASLKLVGNGGTTPNKTLRVASGIFQVLNSAASTVIMQVNDSGNMSSSGGIDGTAIGQVTPAAGTFTALKGNSLAKVYATNTSAQSIPNAAFTTITTWTTSFDANSNFTASTGTFTAPATGYYLVSAGVAWGTMTGGVGVGLSLGIFANAVQVATGYLPYTTTSTFGVLPATVSALVSLTSGQTIQVKAFQNSGGAVVLTNSGNQNYLSITQVP